MRRDETLVQWSLAVVALSAIAVLALIIIFIFKEGSPIIARLSIAQFVTGTKWSPTRGMFGILPMILGSVWVTLAALLIGVPIGLATAIFLAEMAPSRTSQVLKSSIQLLAGIPSVVFGFIGLVILVPFIRQWLGGPGFSVLAAGIVLGIMILPTIVSVCYDVFKAVPPGVQRRHACLRGYKMANDKDGGSPCCKA